MADRLLGQERDNKKRWVLVLEYLVLESGADDSPQISLLTDEEFGEFMRGNSDTDNKRYTIYELGKKTVWSKSR